MLSIALQGKNKKKWFNYCKIVGRETNRKKTK